MNLEDAETFTDRELSRHQARAEAAAKIRQGDEPQSLIDARARFADAVKVAISADEIQVAGATLYGFALGLYYAGAITSDVLTVTHHYQTTRQAVALAQLRARIESARGRAA